MSRFLPLVLIVGAFTVLFAIQYTNGRTGSRALAGDYYTNFQFVRGDVDANGEVSAVPDALYMLRWGFLEGDELLCEDAADIDDDGMLNPLVDSLYLLFWFFNDGPELPQPAECGSDDTLDKLGCEGQGDDGCSDSGGDDSGGDDSGGDYSDDIEDTGY